MSACDPIAAEAYPGPVLFAISIAVDATGAGATA